jgi:hypothetical protein
MKTVLLTLVLAFTLYAATAQEGRVLTEEQYYTLVAITRKQADTLHINEHDFIKLLAVNRKILLAIWDQQDTRPRLAIRKEQ